MSRAIKDVMYKVSMFLRTSFTILTREIFVECFGLYMDWYLFAVVLGAVLI